MSRSRPPLFDRPYFTLEDDDSQRLLDTLKSAYRTKSEIRDFLLRISIEAADVETDGTAKQMWIAVLQHAAQRRGQLRELVEAALRDLGINNYHAPLKELLAGAPVVLRRTADTPLLREADTMLRGVDRLRAPIVIALERVGEQLDESELGQTARHLVVKLTDDHIADLVSTVREAQRAGRSIADLVTAGRRVWDRLCDAEPRLTALHDRIAGGGLTQPVGWHARPALLDALVGALQIANTGGDGPRGFLSVGAGGHYFNPIEGGGTRGVRTFKHRVTTTEPSVGRVDLRSVRRDRVRAALGQVETDVVVVHATPRPVLAELGEIVRHEVVRPTRAVLTFGGPVDVNEIDQLLTVVPFVSSGDDGLADDVTLDALTTVVRRHAGRISLPCVVAAIRAALVARALQQDDADACRRALMWSTWSWIGLPLFSSSYGEIDRALYPNLMDLRSIATREWYFDRRERIPDYQASALIRTDRAVGRFHLYLSGAGGTGKSCFLFHVYDELRGQEESLAVWYRVDAPSSEWDEVARRIREEVVRAAADSLGRQLAQALEQIRGSLGVFLRKAAELLRQQVEGFVEIAVFVDQLERTFESGDAPDASRLEDISKKVVELLDAVGVDNGVRIYIASRKQYLPDFLVSSRAAAACWLEFNVLQTISNTNERLAFVHQVVRWCRNEQLIGRDVTLRDDAAAELVAKVDGNPLNVMLALIQLLAQDFRGAITAHDVTSRKPWTRLFELDLAAAKRDELDLYVLLAMAHARTEIVRFEEVWWRICMVRPELTRRVTDLGSNGVRERLWLLGFIGRTIHARPSGSEPMRYLEFFHANLRDYLLREEMGPGGGERGGTPPAWRALDRLSIFAHDWAQTLQPLLAEEIRVLMEHRDQVIANGLVPDEPDTPPFHLLFLRDPGDARPGLSQAAMACFAYSALVHAEGGRSAVDALFPAIEDRVKQSRDWLLRAPAELLPPILRYLIPLEAAPVRELLVELLLDPAGTRVPEMVRATAQVLVEPLFAARWRGDVLFAVLTAALLQAGGDLNKIPDPVVGLLVVACDRNRDTLLALITHFRDRLHISEDANLRELAPRLEAFTGLDRWLGETSGGSVLRETSLPEATAPDSPPLELVLGSALLADVEEETLARWSASVRGSVGMPLPDVVRIDGEVEPYEAELRFSGQRVARSVFRPGARRVGKRQWEQVGGSRVVADEEDVQIAEDALWLAPEIIEAAGYRGKHVDWDTAVVDWIVDRCRAEFPRLFDADLQVAFLREVASTPTGRDCLRRAGSVLIRTVFVDLVVEGVPIASRNAVLKQLADIAPRIEHGEAATQKIREFLRTDICRSIADDSGEVTTILIDEALERTLIDRIDRIDDQEPLSPAEAIRLDAAMQRLAIRTGERAGPPPAIVTMPRLRRMLALLLHQLDHRLPVISYAEWDEAFIASPGGLVQFALGPKDPP